MCWFLFVGFYCIPFNSFKLKNYAIEFGFQIQTSSHDYAQFNGQSERTVETVKQLMRKALEESNDVQLTLLHSRNTLVSGLA